MTNYDLIQEELSNLNLLTQETLGYIRLTYIRFTREYYSSPVVLSPAHGIIYNIIS